MPPQQRSSAEILAALALTAGTAFILAAVYLTSGSGATSGEIWGRVCLSLGVALVAPTVLSVLHHHFETRTTLKHVGIQEVRRTRSEISGPEWNEFIRSAQSTIWLYGISESGYAIDDETKVTLKRFFADTPSKDARILLLNPAGRVAKRLAGHEGYEPPETLPNAIRDAESRFEAVRKELGCPAGFSIRRYDDYPQFSIVRSDSHMLVTLYIRYYRGDRCPTLRLKQGESSLFGIYEGHFQRAWQEAH